MMFLSIKTILVLLAFILGVIVGTSLTRPVRDASQSALMPSVLDKAFKGELGGSYA